MKIYTCHAINCNATNEQDKNLEDWFYCEAHFTDGLKTEQEAM